MSKSRARSHAAFAGLVLFLALVIPRPAHAAPGDLDPSFSSDGYATAPLERTSIPFSVAIDGDGRTIAVGNSGGKNGYGGHEMLIAYDRDGDPAAGFGSHGVVVGEGRPGSNFLFDVVTDAANRIVAVGAFGQRAVAVRYGPDGRLDQSFGEGGVTELSAYGAASAVALDESGRITVLVGSGSARVFRLTPRGDLDTEFSGDGVAELPIDEAGYGGQDGGLAIDSAGRIYGTDGDGMVRLASDGELDATFGVDGIASLPGSAAGSTTVSIANLILDSEGRPVVTGEFCYDSRDGGCYPLLLRLTAGGAADSGFGKNGQAKLSLIGSLVGAAALPDGRLVVGGGYFDFWGATLDGDDYFVAGIDSNGLPLESFGDGGIARSDYRFTSERAQDLAVSGNRAVVGGQTLDRSPGYFDPLFARYKLDARGAADADADGVRDRGDRCPRERGPRPTGCPLVARKIYWDGFNGSRIEGDLGAETARCAVRQPIVLYRVERGEAEKIAVTKSSSYGSWRFSAVERGDRVYLRAPERLVPRSGRCQDVRSGVHTVKAESD